VVNINRADYNYENIVLLHTQSEQLQEFTIEHTNYIRSAEHVYGFPANGSITLWRFLVQLAKFTDQWRSIK